ncbi:MAG: ribonuclease E [Alphaproteobacteria bacterium]|jgi:ribonuclease E
MFIDGTHREQIRVAVTEKGRVTEFDIESFDKKQTIGNIYLAKVTRVEPSLQAAFVEYGAGRQGFLSFSEIHPDYYQIPVEDRKRLLEEAAEFYNNQDDDISEDNLSDEENDSAESADSNEDSQIDSRVNDIDDMSDRAAYQCHNDTIIDSPIDDAADAPDETVSVNEDAVSDDADENVIADSDTNAENSIAKKTEKSSSKKPRLPRYKIQEVIKKRQILLVQVLKSERGNKGAALTTYLSLAGRYCVLMPNTACGGGISRKITDIGDRKKLRTIIKELEVPDGMGLIIRTAGLQRTKAELRRDYEYLLCLWDNIRQLTMSSIAPSLVYEEGNLIKRALRDIYTRETSKILIQGESAYKQAREIMKMIMPSAVRSIHHYRDPLPLLSRYQVERQLDELTHCEVTLKSGGYLVINHTEALIAIDINSGKSTNAYSVEETAFKTNLEAAEEIARQLRLRDLAGLIVIDFIDMADNGHVRSVERKMRECLKNDKARLQVTPLSTFGLMEMTRQRLRPAMKDLMSVPCEHCQGVGFVQSLEMSALRVLRVVFEEIAQKSLSHLELKCSINIAHYLLNKKRQELLAVEAEYNLTIDILGSTKFTSIEYNLETQIAENAPDRSQMPVYQEPISDSMTSYDENIEVSDNNDIIINNDDDEASKSSKNNTRSRNNKRRRSHKNTSEETLDNTALNETQTPQDTGTEKANLENANPEKSSQERGQKRNDSKRSKFNKKRSRFDRNSHYDDQPALYVTESGNNVVIENPVSVKTLQQPDNNETDNPQSSDENHKETPQIKHDDHSISDNLIVENAVTVQQVVKKAILDVDNVSEVQSDTAHSNVQYSDVMTETKPEVKKEIKQEVEAVAETVTETVAEVVAQPIEEADVQKQARRGWWRSRFGL